jgi:hypothetical protein
MDLCLALVLLISPGSSVIAAMLPTTPSLIDVVDVEARYQFGVELSILGRITPNTSLKEAFLFYQAGTGPTEILPVQPSSSGHLEVKIDLGLHTLPPFSRVYYWFRLDTSDGDQITTPAYWFDYQDNRYTWQSLGDDAFQVNWHTGDLTFGQTILNTAHAGLKAVQKVIPLPPNPRIILYVYANPDDLQTTRQLTSADWTAGYAKPELGVGLVSIRAGNEQKLEAERQIPHEIAHLLLYRWAGTGYPNLPAWLVEGIASSAELYTDPDYDRALLQAVESGQLIPTGELCQALPEDASRSFLAYAQSASLVGYIHQHYGTNRLQALVQSYIDGLGCEEGLQDTLQISINQLENEWRMESLSENVAAASFRKFLPYLVLLGIVLVVPLSTIVLFSKRSRDPGQNLHDRGDASGVPGSKSS